MLEIAEEVEVESAFLYSQRFLQLQLVVDDFVAVQLDVEVVVDFVVVQLVVELVVDCVVSLYLLFLIV